MDTLIVISVILFGGCIFGGIGLYFTLDRLLKEHFEVGFYKWLKVTKYDKDRDEKLMLWFRENYSMVLLTLKGYLIYVIIVIVFTVVILPLMMLLFS